MLGPKKKKYWSWAYTKKWHLQMCPVVTKLGFLYVEVLEDRNSSYRVNRNRLQGKNKDLGKKHIQASHKFRMAAAVNFKLIFEEIETLFFK